MKLLKKSSKLENVCYDIRGSVLTEAQRLEEEGYQILRLNIGNPAPFGFNAPDEIIHDMIINIKNAQGYTNSKGMFAPRKAIMQYSQQKKIRNVDIEDIYIGNGVSELISISMRALLNDNDEVLIPAPDYPLWTASVTLSGGRPVHYICDEKSDWIPDVEDIKNKITDKTKGLVIINPNNPTGSVYPVEILKQLVKIAEERNLIVFSDEIYDKILYDGVKHVSAASLSDKIVFVSFNGLSKAYRAAGFRAGWMVVSGNKKTARDYMEGLDILSNMRLCSNAPAQFAIQTALGGYQSINELLLPGGRLLEQRNLAYDLITSIPGISCVKPKGALYLFPKIDIKKYKISDDEKFIMNLLRSKKILLVHGRGFNWPDPDHFRMVFLPGIETLKLAITRIKDFMFSILESAE